MTVTLIPLGRRSPPSTAVYDQLVDFLAEGHSWTKSALCAQVDPELFYPKFPGDHCAQGKAICASCPVKTPCLTAALEIPAYEDFGVWGGTLENERLRLRQLGRVQKFYA